MKPKTFEYEPKQSNGTRQTAVRAAHFIAIVAVACWAGYIGGLAALVTQWWDGQDMLGSPIESALVTQLFGAPLLILIVIVLAVCALVLKSKIVAHGIFLIGVLLAGSLYVAGIAFWITLGLIKVS